MAATARQLGRLKAWQKAGDLARRRVGNCFNASAGGGPEAVRIAGYPGRGNPRGFEPRIRHALRVAGQSRQAAVRDIYGIALAGGDTAFGTVAGAVVIKARRRASFDDMNLHKSFLWASMTKRRYCLITPCRDEGSYGRRALESVLRQSTPPALWIIVDDGSKDETPQILAEYAARVPFIRVLTRADRGDRKLGGGVIDAFYTGYDTIDPADFTYVCKLDLDLDLPPRYFEIFIDRMEADPRIGTCSGKPYFPAPGNDEPVQLPLSDTSRFISENIADDTSVATTQLFPTACFPP